MHDSIGNPRSRHFGFQIVSRNFRRRYEDALFTGERLFYSAIKKISDVSIFFGLRDTQILELLFGEDVGDNFFQLFRREKVAQPGPGFVVLGHGDESEICRPVGVNDLIETRLDEGAGHLTGAVGAEIEENHPVIVANDSARDSGSSRRRLGGYHGGNDEFVGYTFFVTCADGRDGICKFCGRVAMNDCAIGFFDAFPAIVAVIGEVAAADGCDLSHAELAHFLFELAEEIYSAVGRSVAPVHKTMDENIFDFIFARHLQEREEMIDVRMDAAVADKAEKVELTRATAFHGFEKQRLARKFAVGDELIDSRAVHVNDAAGPDIQVADFAVAHLSDGKTDSGTGRLDERIGKVLQDAVVVGLARESDGIAFGFGAVAPAVEDGEDDRFWALGHGRFCPRVEGSAIVCFEPESRMSAPNRLARRSNPDWCGE